MTTGEIRTCASREHLALQTFPFRGKILKLLPGCKITYAIWLVGATRPCPMDVGMVQAHHGTPVMHRRARERQQPFPHHSKGGYSITTQAAIMDGFPSVASYYSLGRRIHYSVPVKHGGFRRFRPIEHFTALHLHTTLPCEAKSSSSASVSNVVAMSFTF